MTLADITTQLDCLTQDLCFPSEADTPWQVVVWPESAELTDALLQHLDQPAEASVVSQSLTDLSEQVERRCRGYGAEGKAMVEDRSQRTIAAQHQQLFQYLEDQLSEVQIFRVGEVTVEVVVIGVAETGDWVGVRTQSIET
ncbi:MAG: nuclease A inhibitor family protein [Leptolyngbyaceae cyanobacterium]